MREGTGTNAAEGRWRRIVRSRHIWFGLLGLIGALAYRYGPAWARFMGAVAICTMAWQERKEIYHVAASFLLGREYVDEGKTYRYLTLKEDARVTQEMARTKRFMQLSNTVHNGITIADYHAQEPYEPLLRARGKLEMAARLDYGVQLKHAEVVALLAHLDMQDERYKGAGI